MSMMAAYARENYLKAIVKALGEPERKRIGTGELASILGVTSGTATVMIKKLEREGYLTYESYQGCALTDEGSCYGLRVLRRHRLLETFLVETLDMDWADVHDEAERLEHAASEQLIDIIDAYLGYPARDPHGDPIPGKTQKQYTLDDTPLSSFSAGVTVHIVRIEGNKNAFSYYRKEGLIPGARVHVLGKDTDSGLVKLSVGGTNATFALSVLENIYVEKDEKHRS